MKRATDGQVCVVGLVLLFIQLLKDSMSPFYNCNGACAKNIIFCDMMARRIISLVYMCMIAITRGYTQFLIDGCIRHLIIFSTICKLCLFFQLRCTCFCQHRPCKIACTGRCCLQTRTTPFKNCLCTERH